MSRRVEKGKYFLSLKINLALIDLFLWIIFFYFFEETFDLIFSSGNLAKIY